MSVVAASGKPVHRPSAGPSPAARPRVLGALVRRELTTGLGVVLLLTACCTAAAAYQAYGPPEAALVPVLGRLIRRFDLAVGGLMIPFLILRAAARMEADHASGWLSPVMAAGGWRWTYGAASCLAALLAPSLILATAAAALAIAVVALTGSTELIRLLPSTVGGGVLVLATVSVCTVAAGCVLRRTAVTVVVVATVMLMPVFLLMRHALSEASPPAWTLATPLVSPLMVPPADTLNVVRAVVYVLVVGLLAALASHRYAARTP